MIEFLNLYSMSPLFIVMLVALIAVNVHCVILMRAIHDETIWMKLASKMFLLIFLITSIRLQIHTGDSVYMIIWIFYFLYLIVKDNNDNLKEYNKKKGANDASVRNNS